MANDCSVNFLVPSHQLGHKPQVLSTLVDLCEVKDLNWCQFVVDQIKDAASKIDKKNSVRGCLFVLVVISFSTFFCAAVKILN